VPESVLVIACAALAREIIALRRRHAWEHLDLKCIDARLHNRPWEIPDAVRRLIRRHRCEYGKIFVAYADCGTTGALDRVLDEERVERLPGPHCYQLLAGTPRFESLSQAEPGTFYLTDFLARHFDRLVVEPLGLDEHPELRDAYFGNYRRLVYLSQRNDAALEGAARAAAAQLGLDFERVDCGYGALETELLARMSGDCDGQEDSRLLA
jgi:hypothetical protein